MLEEERLLIIKELEVIDTAILSIHQDPTVCLSIEKLYNNFSNKYDLYFANGGDQNNQSIPESLICRKLGIKMIEGLGDKIQSSSWLLNK